MDSKNKYVMKINTINIKGQNVNFLKLLILKFYDVQDTKILTLM